MDVRFDEKGDHTKAPSSTKKKKRKRWQDEFPDGVYSEYPPDPPHPQLVKDAARGDLPAVQKLVEQAKKLSPLRVALAIHARRKRTEIDCRTFYDKTWEWDDDTALHAASRKGHANVVRYLLQNGADPRLKSCPIDDVHETPLEAAKRVKIERCVALLEVAVEFWNARSAKVGEFCNTAPPYDFLPDLIVSLAAVPHLPPLVAEPPPPPPTPPRSKKKRKRDSGFDSDDDFTSIFGKPKQCLGTAASGNRCRINAESTW